MTLEPTRAPMRIEPDGLSHPAVLALLEEHLGSMRALTPAGSVHALDVARLRQPGIRFWSAWEGESLLGCAALADLGATHGEIKSMRTVATHRRSGVARALLNHILEFARANGYRRLSLETGAGAAFHPAHGLYRSFGFADCGPYGSYREDPNSRFMTLELRPVMVPDKRATVDFAQEG